MVKAKRILYKIYALDILKLKFKELGNHFIICIAKWAGS